MRTSKLFLDTHSLLNPSVISENRPYLMGIAIIMVVIYHAFCWIYNPLGPLNIGYLGVDIFLFLSGFGLCRSFERNPLTTFYKNRLKRIYPLYFISVCIVYILCFNKWSFVTFIENLTTIGYYAHNGDNRFDWYINAIFTLYLTFPLLYYYSKLKYKGLAILFCLICVLTHCHPLYWWYDCLISRLPIFIYGIMFSNCYKQYPALALSGLLLYIPCRIYSSQFLASSLLVIPTIIIALILRAKIGKTQDKIIRFCGKYSLEIYLANNIIFWAFDTFEPSVLTRVPLYILIEIITAFIFIQITERIKRIS